ncbi:MAG TPA: hypothetical protein VGH94_09370 [Acidimicrobiales bacterium]|jgi:hypothetical protein
MTATLTTRPNPSNQRHSSSPRRRSAPPAAGAARRPCTIVRSPASAEALVQGHLPRPVRRVPLALVTAPSRVRPSAAALRRRRLLAGAGVTLVALVSIISLRAGVAWLGGEGTAGVTSPTPAVVVAGPGDSYWALAARVHPGGDLRSTVDALVAANGGRELQPGDRVVLPN